MRQHLAAIVWVAAKRMVMGAAMNNGSVLNNAILNNSVATHAATKSAGSMESKQSEPYSSGEASSTDFRQTLDEFRAESTHKPQKVHKPQQGNLPSETPEDVYAVTDPAMALATVYSTPISIPLSPELTLENQPTIEFLNTTPSIKTTDSALKGSELDANLEESLLALNINPIVNNIPVATETEPEIDNEHVLESQLELLENTEILDSMIAHPLSLHQPLGVNTQMLTEPEALKVSMALSETFSGDVNATSASGLLEGSAVDSQPVIDVDSAMDINSLFEPKFNEKTANKSQDISNITAMQATTNAPVFTPTAAVATHLAANSTTSGATYSVATAALEFSNTVFTPSGALDSPSHSFESAPSHARSFLVSPAVSVPVGQPQWSQAVGEKVLWLAAQNVTAADIRLDPPELGPLQVRVSVHQEQASVSFTSHHSAVREALDQSLNRLRDLFNEQGIALMNVDVSDKSFKRQADQHSGTTTASNLADVSDDETPIAQSIINHKRLVDHYV
jgi:Flagellar hook-length control protein FliK